MLNLNRSEAAAGHYRADIDGLRAIAVLSVVLYHYRIPGFSGGFVGVDIFFVISGYLITRLIYAEMREGRFSIGRFYERRIRRIFPAIFALLAVVTLASLVLLFPRDLQQFARSLWATAIFSSNIIFWQQAGYFDSSADMKPLLHTWSLAVEEQFYLIWPSILLLLLYFGKDVNRRRMVGAACAILVLSFAESVRETYYAPTAAFYLLPSRMWELMLGAVLAFGNPTRLGHGIAANTAAILGLLLIGFGVFTYNIDTPFPGLAAIVPCTGAALLIYTGDDNRTRMFKILSAPVMVFIGLISYSFYLWHWPLYVFAKYLSGGPLHPVLTSGLILMSALLAWLSYRFVEQPFRARKTQFFGLRLFFLAGAAMTATVVAGVAIVNAGGLPQRYPGNVQELLAAAADREPLRSHCFNLKPKDITTGRLCRFGDTHAAADFLLWGDSHADALLPAVEAAAVARHRAGLFAARAACPPLLGVERVDIASANCRRFNDAVARVAANPAIRQAILVARWAKHAEGTEYGDSTAPTAFLADDQSKERSIDENRAVFLRGLTRTLDFLRRNKKEIVLVGPIPEVGTYVPEALARAQVFGTKRDLRPTMAQFERRQAFVLQTFARVAATGRVTVIYPTSTLCRSGICDVESSGRPLYADTNHLSVFGAKRLTPLMRRVL